MPRRADPTPKSIRRMLARYSLFVSFLCLPLLSVPARAERPIPPDRTLSGHAAAVMCVAYLPDGQTAVTGSRDRTVKVWDLKSGRILRTLEAHTGFVFALAVSPDGKHVASAGADRTVRVWEINSGKLAALLEGHTASVIELSYMPNGQLLSAGEDSLRLWDVDQEKLLWQSGVGVSELAASADGTRAVVTNYNDGVHVVWDLVKRTQVRTLGGAGHMRPGLAMSPDGAEVVGHDNSQSRIIRRWSVATGKELPFTSPTRDVERIAFSPDGSLLLMGSNACTIWDTKSWKPLRDLEGPRDSRESVISYAFSSDGKTLLGTSGVYLPAQEGDYRLYDNQLLRYDLTHLRTPERGPKSGKLSWEEAPIKVRYTTGKTVSPADFKDPNGESTLPWRRFPGGKGQDFLLTGNSVLLQRSADLIEQRLADPSAHFKDLVWDGRYAWVNSQSDSSISVIDAEGHLVTRIGDAQGLPRSDLSLVLYPLAEGRVLAAGAANNLGNAIPGSGWCGVIELHSDAKPSNPPRVDVFYRDPLPPDNWTHRKENAGRVFFPGWMTAGTPVPADGKAGNTTRYVWVACQGTQFDNLPILRVNPETRGVDLFNFGPPWPQNPGRHRADLFSGIIYWLSNDEMMYHYGAVYRVKPRPTLVDFSDKKLVIDTPWPNEWSEITPFLPIGGQLYVPGQRWERIDPHTLEAEDIGPGFRVDGELARDNVDYFNSAVLGPIAIVKTTAQVYRLSVDPEHPLAVAATLEPQIGKDLPPEGVVEFRDGLTLFYCGDGALSFADGALKPGRTILYPYRNPRADLDGEMTRVHAITSHLVANPSEKERLGLTDEQMRRVIAHRETQVEVDATRLAELFADWNKAASDEERTASTGKLLAQAKEIGSRDTRARRDDVERFKAIFTPRQWKLVNFEIPDK